MRYLFIDENDLDEKQHFEEECSKLRTKVTKIEELKGLDLLYCQHKDYQKAVKTFKTLLQEIKDLNLENTEKEL